MSLKTIRDSYDKLLTTLNEAGIKFDASQKSTLDSFILALESTMSEQRKQAILMTKRATEKKLEKEYGQVFESILKHTHENFKIAAKIQDKVTQINEATKLNDKVDNYLDLYLESVCPQKTIVDYAKMKKLEQINESLRDVLLANDDAVIEKKAQLEESFKKEKGKLETEVAKMQVKLNESMEKNQELNKKLGHYKAAQVLESKTQDLPAFEARKLKKHFATATAPEIEKNFTKVLESVKKEVKEAAEEAETTLEAEVNKIVDSEDIEENDILKGKPHNGHVTEAEEVEENDILKGRVHNGHVNEDEEEDFETTESYKFNEDGDIELDDDDVIDESTMRRWCMQSIETR